jgi:hypothetical protein
MHLLPARLFAKEEKTWGMVITNEAGDPIADASIYGLVLAHEHGHLFNLRHRGPTAKLTDDRLIEPMQRNLMFTTDEIGASLADLDLIQALAVQGSPILRAP